MLLKIGANIIFSKLVRNIDFKVIKFRSMKIDAEKDGIQWSQRRDPRITKIEEF